MPAGVRRLATALLEIPAHPTKGRGKNESVVPFPMWKHILLYAAFLALGAFALQWLDLQRMARLYPQSVYDALLAAGFLALGLWIGARVLGRRGDTPPFDGNPKARAELGISPREAAVLAELAAGLSNKGNRTAPGRVAQYGEDPRRAVVRSSVRRGARMRCGGRGVGLVR